MSHPLIAVTAPVRDSDIGMPRVVLEAGYLQAVRVAGGLPLVVSPLDEEETRERMFDLASGLILTGGEDVDPSRYGQPPDGARTVSPERDAMELALLYLSVYAALIFTGPGRISVDNALWKRKHTAEKL